jgi:hypothetical protein
MRILVTLALIACSKYEPKPETADEQDEAMVLTYEDMANLARENPTCERWASENQRRWGARRLQQMIQRMQSFDKATGDAFRAKYGDRITKADEVVAPLAERCLEEARTQPIRQIRIRP